MSTLPMFHPRVRALALLVALGLAPAPSGCGGGTAEAPRKANVVLVVVDTLRADYANPEAKLADLPHFAAFDADAVSFPTAYAHAPLTLPSHTSLFSARTPPRTGVVINDQVVAAGVPLLQDRLREHGYASQAVVALATLWPASRGQGLDRGFEQFVRGQSSISPAGEVNRDLGRVLDELKEHAPFFLFAHYAEPHEPYEAHGRAVATAELEWNGRPLEEVRTSEWAERRLEVALVPGVNRLAIRSATNFKVRTLDFTSQGETLPVRFESGALLAEVREFALTVENRTGLPQAARLDLWLHDVPTVAEMPARYRAEAEVADAAFGALVALLEERGLYDGSLIVFTSDHGEALGEHDVIGHVVNLHDEMLHVPLMIKLPKGHAAASSLARSRRDLVRLIDVAPTILDVLGLEPLPHAEGESLLASRERLLLAQTSRPEAPRTLLALRDLRTKLVYDVAADAFTMYDLTADPGEVVDIFATAGGQKRAWQTELRGLARSAASPSPSTLDEETQKRLKALGY